MFDEMLGTLKWNCQQNQSLLQLEHGFNIVCYIEVRY